MLLEFKAYVTRLLCVMLYAALPIAVLIMIIGGLKMMSPDPEDRSAGKGLVFWAVAGLLIVIAFVFLASWIADLDIPRSC